MPKIPAADPVWWIGLDRSARTIVASRRCTATMSAVSPLALARLMLPPFANAWIISSQPGRYRQQFGFPQTIFQIGIRPFDGIVQIRHVAAPRTTMWIAPSPRSTSRVLTTVAQAYRKPMTSSFFPS